MDNSAPGAVPESPVPGGGDVVARRTLYKNRHRIEPHWHSRAQFMFAITGTMRVRTPRRAWIVPPSRALWIPPGTVHELQMHGVVEMRSLYIAESAAALMPQTCLVLDVTPLARELVVRASALPQDYDEKGDDGLLMQLLLAEIRKLPRCTLDLPLPESADLVRLCERIMADLAARHPTNDHSNERKTSGRTLYRRFLGETGITFAQWKRQARLLESIRRLADGTPATTVALDMGYESASAFSTMFKRALGVPPRAFIGKTGSDPVYRKA